VTATHPLFHHETYAKAFLCSCRAIIFQTLIKDRCSRGNPHGSAKTSSFFTSFSAASEKDPLYPSRGTPREAHIWRIYVNRGGVKTVIFRSPPRRPPERPPGNLHSPKYVRSGRWSRYTSHVDEGSMVFGNIIARHEHRNALAYV